MTSIVGGIFGLEDPLGEGAPPPWAARASNTLLTANARGAIRWLAEHLQSPRVWAPSYLCHTMVDWIARRDERVRFYPVDGGLCASELGWLDDVRPGDLAIVVAWFGKRADAALAKTLRSRGVTVLVDASQAYFTDGLGTEADWIVFSPRKMLGVADGGALISLAGEPLATISLPEPPWDWWRTLFAATQARREFDLAGNPDASRPWFQLMLDADNNAPLATFAMSAFSRNRLESGVDRLSIIARRLRNYGTLLDGLSDLALFGEYASGEVPLGFVARFPTQEVRDRVRSRLIEERIYPPVHWPINGVVPDKFVESHDLSGRILTLICDQRYDDAAMKRTVRLVRGALHAT